MRTVFAILGMLSAVSACGSSSDPGNLDDPEVRAKLRDIGLQASASAGVPSPKSMTAVWSADHQAAEEVVSGDIVNEHQAVYVIEITGGDFTSVRRGPQGAPAPQGSVLTLTIDAQTFEETDAGLTTTAPDLSKIDSHIVNLLN